MYMVHLKNPGFFKFFVKYLSPATVEEDNSPPVYLNLLSGSTAFYRVLRISYISGFSLSLEYEALRKQYEAESSSTIRDEDILSVCNSYI